jgi:hypothetical protein
MGKILSSGKISGEFHWGYSFFLNGAVAYEYSKKIWLLLAILAPRLCEGAGGIRLLSESVGFAKLIF